MEVSSLQAGEQRIRFDHDIVGPRHELLVRDGDHFDIEARTAEDIDAGKRLDLLEAIGKEYGDFLHGMSSFLIFVLAKMTYGMNAK